MRLSVKSLENMGELNAASTLDAIEREEREALEQSYEREESIWFTDRAGHPISRWRGRQMIRRRLARIAQLREAMHLFW